MEPIQQNEDIKAKMSEPGFSYRYVCPAISVRSISVRSSTLIIRTNSRGISRPYRVVSIPVLVEDISGDNSGECGGASE